MPGSSTSQPAFTHYYDGLLGGHLFRWLDRAKLKAAGRFLAQADNLSDVLDLGCGKGAISSRLLARLPSVRLIGADNDPGLLAEAERRGLVPVRVDFDKPLPFDDARFDAVIMIDSIEHVASRADVFRDVARILKTDGRLLIFTPPYDTASWTLGEKLHRVLTRRQAGHISPFTRESLSWCLDRWFHEWSVRYLNMGLTMCGMGVRKKDVPAGEGLAGRT